MIISRCNTYIWSGRGQSWVTTLRCCYQYSQQVPPKQPPHRGDEEAPREPPTSVNSTPHTPPPSTWRKGVNIIKSFGQGAKLLFGDIKKMRQVKRLMGGFKLSGATPMERPSNNIKLEDVQFVYKTSADIKRTLPTMVLFCIPLLGYVAPFLALMFPGQLLSTHFWSEKQKNELIEKSIKQRRTAIPEFVTFTSEKSSNEIIVELVNKLHSQGIIHQLPSTDSSTTLDNLPARHIQLLSQCWGVSRALIPINWFQTRKLRKHLHYIETCDWMLLRQTDSVEHLDPELLNELVRERLPLQYPSNHLNEKLKKWLEMKSLAQDAEIFNEVYLAHMVVASV